MPSQPLMVGESRLQPRVVSAVPGMLRPTPRTSSSRRPVSSSSASRRLAISGINSWGPMPISWSTSAIVRTTPARLQTPSWVRLRPIAAASTTPASALKTSRAGGRPPVDGASARSSTKPRACSVETRAATAVRDRPVRRPTSARVLTAPSRIRPNTSPAVAGAGEDRDMRISAIQPTSYCTYNTQSSPTFTVKIRK